MSTPPNATGLAPLAVAAGMFLVAFFCDLSARRVVGDTPFDVLDRELLRVVSAVFLVAGAGALLLFAWAVWTGLDVVP